jgi:hypothetical protein
MRAHLRIAAIALLALTFVAIPFSACRAEGKALRWILNGPAVTNFTTDPTAVAFFSNTRPFVIIPKTRTAVAPASWDAIGTRIFTSYAEFHWAVTNGKIAPNIKAVLYDNEAWDLTPKYEQNQFAEFAQRFAELAHQNGYLVIVTPAVDLATAQQAAGEPRFATFLRLNIPAIAAKYADVYEIQAQGSQIPANTFASYVSEAAAQARAANPRVLVFAGISTNPSGHHVTADQILAAIAATRNVVDGYWFNVPAPGPSCPNCNDFRPDMAIDVLRRLHDSR